MRHFMALAATMAGLPVGAPGNSLCNMTPELDGTYYASNPEAFGLSSVLNIKTDFLAKSRKMAAPEIAEMIIRFNGSVAGVTGGALGIDTYKLVKKLIIQDDEEFVNISGASIRVLEQMDFGSKQVDPADVASAATSSSFVSTIRFTFEPPRMHRPKDFRVPTINLLEAGTLQLQLADALPTGWGTTSLSCRVWCRVVDGRKKELKSRRKVTEQSFNRDDDFYPIDGAIRALLLSSVLTTTGYTDLSGITVQNSTNLEIFPDFPNGLAIDRYIRSSDSPLSATLDQVRAKTAISIISPDRNQKIGAMPMVKAAHLRMGSTPASCVLIRDVLVNRPMNVSGLLVNQPDQLSYQRAVTTSGRVRDGKSGGTPVTQYNPDLARILPIRVGGE